MISRASGPSAVSNFISGSSLGTTSTSYNFGSFATSSGGVLVVFHFADMASNFVISGCSIGGVAATIAQASSGAGVSYREVPSSGSYNVTVTFPSSASRCAIAVYLVTSYASRIPTDSSSIFRSSTVSASLSLYIDSGGVGMWGNRHGNTNATVWSNATENVDAISDSVVRYTSANYSATTATSRSATATWSGSVYNDIAGISFR